MPRKPASAEKTLFPLHASLEELAQAAKDCKVCDLWKCATQTVFGEGGAQVKVMLVGEQPGNQEYLEGKPFVGPQASCSMPRLWRRELIARRYPSPMR